MRVAEFTAYHLRIPLKKTIRHASYVRRANDTLVLRCRLEDGTEGWGEGLPRPYVTGESIETAWQHIHETDFSESFSEPIADLSESVARCRGFQLAELPGDHRDCFGNAVRCAIELSVLDAVCRSENIPLSSVTSVVREAAPIRASTDAVQYSTAITASSRFRACIRAWLFRLYGFRQIKVKVGVEGSDDAKLLKAVRRIVGPKIDLRIDANEAWSCENLQQKLEPLLPYDISAVEQPVPHEQADRLAAIHKEISVPIMLDESLCSFGDAKRAIDRGTCDLFNIRLSKCGGYLNSLLIAALAHESGLGYQLGCQVGETGILSAAGRHFACSVGRIRYLEGSYDRHLVKERLTQQDLTFGRGGRASALAGPGLGVDIDAAAVRRTCVAEHHIPVAVRAGHES